MRIYLGAVCLLVASATLLAQSDRGNITGTVSDRVGAVVAGAAVEARNTETGAAHPVASSATGNYTIAELPAVNRTYLSLSFDDLEVTGSQMVCRSPVESAASRQAVLVTAGASRIEVVVTHEPRAEDLTEIGTSRANSGTSHISG